MIVGLGVDIVDLERIRGMLERLGIDRVCRRFLTDGEREYCLRMRDPVRHVAARVAAKEAAFKALAGSYEARSIGWKELEVTHDAFGRPQLKLHGRAEIRARELRVNRVHLSMTHGDTSAVATAVAESIP
jgi:holo-[acyl-carrier protein] synthase